MAIKITQAAATGISVSQAVPKLTLSKIGAQGATGPQGPTQGVPVFIQDAAPSASGAFLWIDTAGANVQVKFEDGL